MKIAGIEIPKHLEFGNEEHIKIKDRIEQRLELIENGKKCSCCGYKVMPKEEKAKNQYFEKRLKWLCRHCGVEEFTDLDGNNEGEK